MERVQTIGLVPFGIRVLRPAGEIHARRLREAGDADHRERIPAITAHRALGHGLDRPVRICVKGQPELVILNRNHLFGLFFLHVDADDAAIAAFTRFRLDLKPRIGRQEQRRFSVRPGPEIGIRLHGRFRQLSALIIRGFRETDVRVWNHGARIVLPNGLQVEPPGLVRTDGVRAVRIKAQEVEVRVENDVSVPVGKGMIIPPEPDVINRNIEGPERQGNRRHAERHADAPGHSVGDASVHAFPGLAHMPGVHLGIGRLVL